MNFRGWSRIAGSLLITAAEETEHVRKTSGFKSKWIGLIIALTTSVGTVLYVGGEEAEPPQTKVVKPIVYLA